MPGIDSTLEMALPIHTCKRFLNRVVRPLEQRLCYSAPSDGLIPPAKRQYVPTSGTYPKGFLAGSVHVGVKSSNTKFDDLAIVASESPCSAAAVFTQNKFQAAPVTVSRDILTRRGGDGIRAVIVNSGCANAVTGKGGIEDARSMGQTTDACFNDTPDDGMGSRTLVMSTGVIGQRYVHFSFTVSGTSGLNFALTWSIACQSTKSPAKYRPRIRLSPPTTRLGYLLLVQSALLTPFLNFSPVPSLSPLSLTRPTLLLA